MAKKFYIFEVVTPEGNDAAAPSPVEFRFRQTFNGTVIDARELLSLDTFEDSTYLILEDTSGEIVKGTDTIVKRSVRFDPPRKKTRKPPAVAEEAAIPEETPALPAPSEEEVPRSRSRRGARS